MSPLSVALALEYLAFTPSLTKIYEQHICKAKKLTYLFLEVGSRVESLDSSPELVGLGLASIRSSIVGTHTTNSI